jgi:hypothetical protein
MEIEPKVVGHETPSLTPGEESKKDDEELDLSRKKRELAD